MPLSPVEEQILDRVQREVPLVPHPYRSVADSLGISESSCIDHIVRMKNDGILRNIAGIFNAHRLGYVSTLVCFKVPEAAIETAAAAINTHPGVSHNYLRDHAWNIWFTLAVDSPGKLELTVSHLAAQCCADDALILRNERLFKIGVVLPLGDRSDAATVKHQASSTVDDRAPLTEEDREAVRVLQRDLPVISQPFDALLRDTGSPLDGERLLTAAARLKQKGIMRRYAAVLRHRAAGFTANAMTAWKLSAGQSLDDVVTRFSAVPTISHLYLRTVYPGRWEHPLFAMIHARSEQELASVISELSAATGIQDYLVLRSIREFKKERVTYFSHLFEEWDYREGI